MEQDLIHDVLLTSFGYMPIWIKFKIIDKTSLSVGQYRAFIDLYDNLKSLSLPDGRAWKEVMPLSNPLKSWGMWEEKTREFYANPNLVAQRYVKDTGANWEGPHDTLNKDLSLVMKEFSDKMNLCTLYDAIWPRVAFNYRVLEPNAWMNKYMKRSVLEKKELYSRLPPIEWLD